MISVLILTLNEGANLADCLDSVSWCDDIVVFDSHSTDRTCEIATDYGVRLYKRKFDGYAMQRNAALTEVEYKHPWVLMVDADERWPREMSTEIFAELSKNYRNRTLYHFRRKDMFMGRWLRRSSGYPTWFGRLVRLGHVEVKRNINEEYHTSGESGYLRSHFIHYPFNNGFSAWIEKHNRYSSMEAELIAKKRIGKIEWGGLTSKDPIDRRRQIKGLIYRMPFRPLIMFLSLYLIRGGLLDGRAGLTFCILRSYYEFMIDCKVREIRRRDKGLPL
jgi:glycosyltransferase involved in cell wall biosynthesis